MSSPGIHRRLRRLLGPGGRVLLFAADHGIPAGPLPGLEDPHPIFQSLVGSPITGIVVNPGMVRFVPAAVSAALVVHLSAGTLLGSSPTSKVLASSPARAVAMGADAVSVQVHFGAPAEDRMLADAGRVVDEAGGLGIPVLIMAYPPGMDEAGADPEDTRQAARASAELGADLVQVPHPGSTDRVRNAVRGCPIPLLTTGGPRASDLGRFLASVRSAMEGGASGLSVGRNLFQHPDPGAFAEEIGKAVFGEPHGVPVESA